MFISEWTHEVQYTCSIIACSNIIKPPPSFQQQVRVHDDWCLFCAYTAIYSIYSLYPAIYAASIEESRASSGAIRQNFVWAVILTRPPNLLNI